jgi:hypothetical protein
LTISTTTLESSTPALASGSFGWSMWIAVFFIVAGAAIYSFVIALAANWANHKKMFVVRRLILIWGWAHPALLALMIAVSVGFGPIREMFNSREGRIQEVMRPVKVIWLLSLIVWVWILTTRVEKRRTARSRR